MILCVAMSFVHCCCCFCHPRLVLLATVSSTEFYDYYMRQKPADKKAALDIKALLADTSSTFFKDATWCLDTLAPFVSVIREVRQLCVCAHVCVSMLCACL